MIKISEKKNRFEVTLASFSSENVSVQVELIYTIQKCQSLAWNS